MTTYTFTGIRLTSGPTENLTSVAPVTLRLVVTDDYRFGYENLGAEPSGGITRIDVTTTIGNIFSSIVNGREITESWDVLMTRVDRPGGQATDTNIINFYDPSTRSDFLFEISGPRLPPLTTLAQVASFEQSVTFNSLWTRPLVDSDAINPATFTSLTSVTQNDVINLAGQSWTGGVIRAGLGNDRVTGTNGADTIDLGDGNDVCKSGAGADNILGQAGNDQLFGGRDNDTMNGGLGDDTLDGGAGADRLIGSKGLDRFVFKAGYDNDSISGFQNGVDKIDLSRFNLTEAQVLAAATEVSGNVVIDLGNGDVLTVLKTTEAILSGDFIL
jgi:Ca2+-binding RTX toxin-like protein